MPEKNNYYLIACGTRNYNDSDNFGILENVPTEIDTVVDLLTSQFGYQRVLPDLDLNPRGDEIKQQFANWLLDEERCETDCVIFYYSGHGEYITGHNHYLILENTDSRTIPQTALATEELVLPLNNDGVKISQILFMIDTCFSQGGAGDITQFTSNVIQQYLPVEGAEIAVHTIAACRARQTAEENVYSQIFKEVIEDFTLSSITAGHICPNKLVNNINQKLILRSSDQHVIHSNIGSQSYAKFFPIIPQTLQTWDGRRQEFTDELSSMLNQNLDTSLFLINSFLLTSKFLEEFILDYPDLTEKLQELSMRSVANKICPLIACAEWCRQKFNDNRDQEFYDRDLALEIDNWLNEVIRYRAGTDINKIKEFVRTSFKNLKNLIGQEDLRLQIEIEPKKDEFNNTGLDSGSFSLNMNLWIRSKELPLGRFAQNEPLNIEVNDQDSNEEICDSLRTYLQQDNFLLDRIRKARYSLCCPVQLKIECFLPFNLYQLSLEEICFASGPTEISLGQEYPIFINSYERYFDRGYREIKDRIYFEKQEFWNEDNSREPNEFCFVVNEPSLDDLETIEFEFAIAIWSRDEGNPISEDDLNISDWKNLPDNICNLRQQRDNPQLTLFWDDLYPKPSDRSRPLITDLVE